MLLQHSFFNIYLFRRACVLSRSVLPDLRGPVDCSPPGSSVRGSLQTRTLKWGSHSLLQGIFLTRETDPALLHGRVDSSVLHHLGSPAEGLALAGCCVCSGSDPPGSSGGEEGATLVGQGCGACVLVTQTPNEASCLQPQLTLERQLEPPGPERPASAHRCPVLKARSQGPRLPGIPEPSRKEARAPSPGPPKNLHQAPRRSRLAWGAAFLSDASAPPSTSAQ